MSKIEQLIQQYCPNGVEYKTIGEICKVSRGVVISKDYIRDNVGEYPVYSSQTENDGCLGCISTYAQDGEFLTWTTDGANAGTIFHRTGKFNITNVCGLLKVDKNIALTRFVFHILSVEAPKYVLKGMGNAKLMSNVMSSISIPVPPLPVQEEIVRILDAFTSYTAELQAELQARRKQYDYYRNRLLSFDGRTDVQRRKLGEVCLVTKLAGYEFTKYVTYSNTGSIIALRGLNVKKGQLDLSDVKYIDQSDFSKLNRSKLRVNDMLFTYVGTIGQVALVDKNDRYYLAPNVAMVRIQTEGLSPRFLLHYCQSQKFWQSQINRLLQQSSMQNIPMEKIRLFEIPIPPIEEQQRIVDILDRFDVLCNDLTTGLPAEIEARQKQYEYYRDRLLNFKKKEA